MLPAELLQHVPQRVQHLRAAVVGELPGLERGPGGRAEQPVVRRRGAEVEEAGGGPEDENGIALLQRSPPQCIAQKFRQHSLPELLAPSGCIVHGQIPQRPHQARQCRRCSPRRGPGKPPDGARQPRAHVAQRLQAGGGGVHRTDPAEKDDGGRGVGLLGHVVRGDVLPEQRGHVPGSGQAMSLHQIAQEPEDGVRLLVSHGSDQLDYCLHHLKPLRYCGN
mmetsp:Transcript_21049/g.59542  ORF Transcript_21049/g.59542 Transcript_21049/m.59542 type:complete len:221 (+) Transcript_21049:748-1410(+)